MQKMRAAQIARPGAPFEIVERDIPQPGAGAVRIKVQACGVCHSDTITKQGLFPGIQYPRVPGHEVVGVVDTIGTGVTTGSRASASAWAGTAVIAANAISAGAAIFLPANPAGA
jgi:D-arabinose 1-dehydrogenase-like Zn-dependent alcohol dehydrogenase